MKEQILNHFSDNFKQFFEKYLQNVQRISGNEFEAICSFHKDTDPSFNFNNQTGVYFCHGCGQKGDIFHFFAKDNGLDTGRDFSKILKGIADDFGIFCEHQKPKITKTYDYLDADGQRLFQVCRKEPKAFSQRRPNGKGGWIWNLKGVTRVLYRLPQVIKAHEIIIVEGEKDADNLAALGFAATTCPMGAKKWREEYNEPLKGKDVVLIPDNDDQGHEHMAKVGISLNGYAKSLKLLQLPKLPNKGDSSDFIQTFDNPEDAAERLSVLIENAPQYTAPKNLTIEDIILDVTEFSKIEIPDLSEFLFPWLKEDSINLISGWRGCGKTWFALAILDAVTKGTNCGPWECRTPVPCLFLDGEMTIQDDRERIESLHLNSNRECSLYFYSDAYANQLGLPRAVLLDESWRENMKHFLINHKVKLWVIDNLASLAGGLDENSKKDWDPINQWLLELRFAGISTIMLHHVNKEGGQRGTSAREDNLDISIMLKKPGDYTPEDGARFIAHFSKTRIQTKYLSLVGDTEFKLILDNNGQYVWSYSNVKQDLKREVIKMLDEGMEQKTIAGSLGLSKGYVCKLRKQAIAENFLTTKNKLTPSGFDYVLKG